MTTLATLRRELASAKIELRAAKDAHETVKAIAEQVAIDRGASGKNAEERARGLSIALFHDSDYTRSLDHFRDCEASVDQFAAEIAIAEDDIRANEARIREKLADALLGQRIDDAASDQPMRQFYNFATGEEEIPF